MAHRDRYWKHGRVISPLRHPKTGAFAYKLLFGKRCTPLIQGPESICLAAGMVSGNSGSIDAEQERLGLKIRPNMVTFEVCEPRTEIQPREERKGWIDGKEYSTHPSGSQSPTLGIYFSNFGSTELHCSFCITKFIVLWQPFHVDTLTSPRIN